MKKNNSFSQDQYEKLQRDVEALQKKHAGSYNDKPVFIHTFVSFDEVDPEERLRFLRRVKPPKGLTQEELKLWETYIAFLLEEYKTTD